MTKPTRRIASIDILRGADLFLLLFLQPVLLAVSTVYSAPWYRTLMHQLDHEVWEGFRIWDLVMPLFLFMVGASMPFSLSKYTRGSEGRSRLYARIARRFLLLFILGMIVQGNLLALDINSLQIYNNTLQAIAAGYLIAALILINVRSATWQIIITLLLMTVYSIPMQIVGDYSHGHSFAYMVDEAVIGRFRGDLTYTWIWSSLTFGATVMTGALCGRMIFNGLKRSDRNISLRMVLIGIALVALGWALGFCEPIIKRLWTSSMVLFSSGWCFLLMALFYWWIDVRQHSKGLNWLKIYGMNAITAYCIGEVVNFRSIVVSLTFGLQHLMGDGYHVILVTGNCLILFGILWFMHRYNIYLKV